MEPMEEPGDKERAGDGGPDEELEEVFMLTAERCSDGDHGEGPCLYQDATNFIR